MPLIEAGLGAAAFVLASWVWTQLVLRALALSPAVPHWRVIAAALVNLLALTKGPHTDGSLLSSRSTPAPRSPDASRAAQWEPDDEPRPTASMGTGIATVEKVCEAAIMSWGLVWSALVATARVVDGKIFERLEQGAPSRFRCHHDSVEGTGCHVTPCSKGTENCAISTKPGSLHTPDGAGAGHDCDDCGMKYVGSQDPEMSAELPRESEIDHQKAESEDDGHWRGHLDETEGSCFDNVSAASRTGFAHPKNDRERGTAYGSGSRSMMEASASEQLRVKYDPAQPDAVEAGDVESEQLPEPPWASEKAAYHSVDEGRSFIQPLLAVSRHQVTLVADPLTTFGDSGEVTDSAAVKAQCKLPELYVALPQEQRPVHPEEACSAKLAAVPDLSGAVSNPNSPSSASGTNDLATPADDFPASGKWKRCRRVADDSDTSEPVSPRPKQEVPTAPRHDQPTTSNRKPVVVLRRGDRAGPMLDTDAIGSTSCPRSPTRVARACMEPHVEQWPESRSASNLHIEAVPSNPLAQPLEPRAEQCAAPQFERDQSAESNLKPCVAEFRPEALAEAQRMKTPQDLRREPLHGSLLTGTRASAPITKCMATYSGTGARPNELLAGSVIRPGVKTWKPSLRLSPGSAAGMNAETSTPPLQQPSNSSMVTSGKVAGVHGVTARRSFYNVKEPSPPDS